MGAYTNLSIKKTTKETLKQCKELFISENEILKGIKITDDKIVEEIASYYLDGGGK